MKPIPVFVALSLVANLALGVVYVSRRAVVLPPTAVAESAVAARVAPAETGSASVDGTPGAKAWTRISAGSDSEYVQKLRAENFPREVIRALVNLRIRARYADRLQALKGPEDDAYWRNRYGGNSRADPETRVARRALEREINDALKLALGPEPEKTDAERERTYGSLSPDKIAQLEAILSDYREMQAGINDRGAGLNLSEDREQLRLLERERRADIAALLTPEELEAYEMRSSPSAGTVRRRLQHFDPTESEYRALVRQQLAFDEKYSGANLTRDERQRRATAEKDLLAQAAQVLSPDRYAEFQLVSDPAYGRTVDALQSFNYDTAVARRVFSVQRDTAAKFQELRARDPDAAARNAGTDRLRDEAMAKLSLTLSPPALESYLKSPAGSWLRRVRANNVELRSEP